LVVELDLIAAKVSTTGHAKIRNFDWGSGAIQVIAMSLEVRTTLLNFKEILTFAVTIP